MNKPTSFTSLFRRITGLFVVLFVVGAIFGFTLPKLYQASAVAPTNIVTYQGRILNSNGVPVSDASLSMIFELYDASSGGTCVWSNSSASCASATARTVTLTNGLFSENLGDTSASYAAIGDSIFADNATLYLQVTIGGETLSPRKLITAAPYALNAQTLDGLSSADFLAAAGDTGTGDYDFTGAIFMGASPLVFEGLSDDGNQTTFAVVDPSGANTITFQDGSGTVAFTSDITNYFTDSGTEIYITTATRDFAVGGTAAPSSPFGVDESANTIYFGEGSGSNASTIWRSSGADTGTITYNTDDEWSFTGGDIDANGGTVIAADFSCTDCLDFAEIIDTPTLDNTTTIDFGSNNFELNLDSTGDFVLQDATTSFFTFNDDQTVDFATTLTTSDALDLTLDSLTTATGLDVTSASGALTSGSLTNVTHNGTYTASATLSGTGSSFVRNVELDDSGASTQTLTITGPVASFSSDTTLTSGSAITDSANVVTVSQVSTSATGSVLSVSNAGIGAGLFVDQNGNTGTTVSDALGGALHVTNTGNNDSGLTVYSDNATTGSPLVHIELENAAADETALFVLNDGFSSGIRLDQNGSTLATVDDLTGGALHIGNTGNNDHALTIYSDNSTTSQPLVYFAMDNSSADEEILWLEQDGLAPALLVNQDGATGSTVDDTNGGAVHISNTGNTDYGFTVYTNIADTSDTALARLWADNTNFDQDVLQVFNDGGLAALRIDQATDPTNGAIDVNASALTTGTIFEVDGSGLTTGRGFEISVDSSLDTAGAAIFVDFGSSSGTSDDVIVVETDIDSSGRDAFVVEADGDTQIGQGALCLDDDGSCAGSTDGTIYYLATSTGASDLAEIYPSTESLEAGDVIVIDSASTGGIRRSTQAYEQESISAIATQPAMLMGAPTDEELFAAGIDVTGGVPNWGRHQILPGTYPVALAGRIPVKVNTENGSISVGDLITTSSTPGVGMKATAPGAVVGRALENYSGSGTGLIEVYVLAGWHSGGAIANDGTVGTFEDDFAFTETQTATSGSPAASSHALALRGSVWNGASAESREMVIQTNVTATDDYQLSVRNNDDDEVAFINNAGDLALSGRLYPSDRGTLQTNRYIYYDGSTGAGGDFIRTNASGWGSGSYDFAEMFPSAETLSPGEVVIFADGKEQVQRSKTRTYDPRIAGIVSTQPGFLAGENLPGHVPVALAGRVPTYVTDENGSIAPGDPLTTSSRGGYAMKATEQGPIVGYAMEAFTGTTGVITVFVRPSYYDGQPLSEAPAANNGISGLNGSISHFDITGVLNLNAGSILNVASLSGIAKKWRIEEDGDVFTAGRFVHLIDSFQGEQVETYATVSRQTTVEISGTAKLVDGRAVIRFEEIDPLFNDVISLTSPYRVFLTASSATDPLYAVNRDLSGFMIRESGGSSNTLVDWLVIAYHKDFEPDETEEDPFAQEPRDDPAPEPDPDVTDEEVSTEEDSQTPEEPAQEDAPSEDPPAESEAPQQEASVDETEEPSTPEETVDDPAPEPEPQPDAAEETPPDDAPQDDAPTAAEEPAAEVSEAVEEEL